MKRRAFLQFAAAAPVAASIPVGAVAAAANAVPIARRVRRDLPAFYVIVTDFVVADDFSMSVKYTEL